ncbi:MAG TPA: DUF4301 family protein [Planctomycetota bacterium]|nr:DUF4301 family protein [Planctomycetota bacterium]
MFDSGILKQLAERRISPEEAERQLALFAHPPAPARLLKPARVGDGILRLSDADQGRYERRGSTSVARRAVTKFVPASGAATRMFKDLLAFQNGAPETEEVRSVREGRSRFAFGGELEAIADPLPAILQRYSQKSKGLIPFHRVDGRARTSFEEQLREAAAFLADAEGRVRLHFTVSPEHRAEYEALYAALKPALERELGRTFDTGFSEQDPSTDTLAGGEDLRPFCDEQGRLVFRPGGHGSLIKNLQDLAANSGRVVIKNIDNVAHPRFWPEILRWKQILIGLLDETQEAAFDRLRRLKSDPAAAGEARGWAESRWGIPASGNDAAELLHRPLRVCGVVANAGEPGGGPFWVDGSGGPSLQIVESAQVDAKDPAQKALFESSTHFNPVDLACGLQDEEGKPYDLSRYVDERASFVAKKSQGGKTLLALERPGLWNGTMAGWNTLFVEVPLITFNPVKTLSDLLRKEQLPA